ncbi:MAG TPA: carboxyl transferase domain-containing protein [Thermoanaerobaculia bacterium]|nr:carboxyl transferase domain-containing protein [Thermoanaerobaculia bacterium]
MSRIESQLKLDQAYDRRRDHWLAELERLAVEEARLREGGGARAQERQRAQGKRTARERVALLCDPGSDWLELGLWAAHGMYAEWGGAPGAGVVAGIGSVHGRDVVVVADDATVKAGAKFPLGIKKLLRAQEIALENRLPIVYLVDSAGVFLPMQDEIFPDREHYGRIFYNNARLSAAGVFQAAAIVGSCVAGGAYLPIMSDETHIVEGVGSIFLAGAHLVQAAIGERIDNEALGGAVVQADISGVVDHRHPDEASCLATLRSQVEQLGGRSVVSPFATRAPRAPRHDPEELLGIVPVERTRPYDAHELLARLLDDSELDEFKATYGRTLVCGTGWIEGHAVGVVANQRSIVERRTGLESKDRELQIGGVIYSDSADKAARFVEICNQKKVPLLFLQDVTGFMVGSRAERGGIIKDGAKLVNVVANSVVPKITVFVGNSFGAGNYAMCGKAYGARFLFAWPSAQIAVMGGEQASKTLAAIQLKNRGAEVSEEEKSALLADTQKRYADAMDPRFAAARLWVDGIVDPRATRAVVARCLAACARNPELPEFKTGVLQT